MTSKYMMQHCGWLLSLLCLAVPAWADKGTVVRQTELRQKPFSDAATQGQVAAGAVVEIQKHEGAWLLVKSATTQGWVKLLNVRTSSNDTNVSPVKTSVTGLAGLLVSSMKGNAVTTGVKGLTSENLEEKEPNYSDIDRIHLFTIEPALAEQTALEVKLKSLDVPAIAITAAPRPEVTAAAAK